MRLLATTLLALALLGGGARAQDEAERLRLAREVLAANRSMETMSAVLPTMMNAIRPATTRNDPKIEKDYDVVVGLMQKELDAVKDGMAEDFARLHARLFTAAELRDMKAFFLTPTGQKLARSTPEMTQAAAVIGQKYAQQMATQFAERVKAELRKRGHNI